MIYFHIECGDHINTNLKNDAIDMVRLGNVNLLNNQKYTSCRSLCNEKYRDFDFYFKHVGYQHCGCFRLRSGAAYKFQIHGAFTFGFAEVVLC